MKLFATITLLCFALLSCSKNNTQEVNDQSALMTSSKEVETTNTSKEIAVVYHSVDGGMSWSPFDSGIPNDATVSAFLVNNNNIIASTDIHGIYSIQEGQQEWKRIDQNLPNGIDINAIAVVNNAFVIGTLGHGVMLSKDNGKIWSNAVSRIKTAIRSFHVKDNILFAGTDDGIYKSSDNGNTWEHIWKGIQVNGFTEANNKIYAALRNGAMLTADGGKNWKYIYEPHTLHDISTDGQNIYAMTLGDGLKKSDNDGLSWENINTGLGTLNLYTFEVKTFGHRLYAAQWYGIYSSENGGKNWNLIKNGLPDSTAFTTLEKTTSGLVAGIGLRKK